MVAKKQVVVVAKSSSLRWAPQFVGWSGCNYIVVIGQSIRNE